MRLFVAQRWGIAGAFFNGNVEVLKQRLVANDDQMAVHLTRGALAAEGSEVEVSERSARITTSDRRAGENDEFCGKIAAGLGIL